MFQAGPIEMTPQEQTRTIACSRSLRDHGMPYMTNHPGGPDSSNSAPTPPPPAFDEIKLKAALTAFKKRLKLTKLDEESKLGGGRPTTTGKQAAITGIVPPREFPNEIWEELARRGQIKHAGRGFYGPA